MSEREHDSGVRQTMLVSIRRHLATSAPYDAVRKEHSVRHEATTETNSPIAASQPTTLSLLELFSQSLEAVAGNCIVVRDEMEAAEAVQRVIELTKAKRGAVSDSELVRRVIERVKVDAELLMNPALPELFDCDVGITSAQWAVAETGTLVLEAEQERHRLASLVPPVHIALIEASMIRMTLAEVLESLGQKQHDELSPTVTFITGPSRTSDIELNLTIGVHGPGELYVIILEMNLV